MNVAKQEKWPGARPAHLCLSVPPDPKLGGYVRQEVMAFTEIQGIADGDVIDFVIAIGEAVANAIEHSHSKAPIEVTAWLLGDDRLFASVIDRGIGFTPSLRSNLPDPLAERGRGLPIMRRYADIFSVHTAPGEGTRVTLGCHVHR